MNEGLAIEVVRKDRHAVIWPAGYVDLATAPLLQGHAQHLLRDGVQDLVVDASEMTYMDSSGVAVLVGLHNAADREGNQVSVANPTRIVRLVLDICGISDMVEPSRS